MFCVKKLKPILARYPADKIKVVITVYRREDRDDHEYYIFSENIRGNPIMKRRIEYILIWSA